MKAKEYLQNIYKTDTRIDCLQSEVNSIQERLESITPQYNASEGSNGSRNVHSHEALICKMIDLKTEIDKQLNELLDLKTEAKKAIDKIISINADYGAILYKRYFEYKSWEKIANELCFSYPHIFRLHNNALELFEKTILNDNKYVI